MGVGSVGSKGTMSISVKRDCLVSSAIVVLFGAIMVLWRVRGDEIGPEMYNDAQ